jgi:TonB-linked SusC/RagA family outer membrane protein
MKRILLISFVLMSALISEAWAQRTVSGKVSGSDGEGLPGVTVRAKGTRTGVNTDFDGKYRLNVPEGSDKLVFSFVGFTTQEVEIGSRSVIDVVLEEDVKQLQEVVVTGYGQRQKNEFTGSISTMSGDLIEDRPVATVEQALQGNVAGLQLSSSSGTPGATQDIRIRGISSITAGNEPLFVIDGIPVVSSGTGSGTATSSLGVLSSLNSNDIESISVLKDASAAAIYGARASNGVIIITTKSGKSGKPRVKFSAQSGYVAPAVDGPQMLNAAQRDELYYEALVNAGKAESIAEAKEEFPSGWDGETDTDWNQVVSNEDAMTHNYNLSVNGGSDKSTYYASIGYFQQDGVNIGKNFDRYSGKLSFQNNLTDKIALRTSFTGSHVTQLGQLEGAAYFGNPELSRLFNNPFDKPRNEDGSINLDLSGIVYNPLYIAENDIDSKTMTRAFNSTSLEYEIVDGLKFTTDLGLDYLITEQLNYNNRVYGDSDDEGGSSYTYLNRNFNFVWRNMLDYTWRLNDDNKLDFKLAYEAQKNQFYFMGTGGYGFGADGLIYPSSVGTPDYAGGYSEDWAINSVVGMVNYSFRGNVFLDGTLRREGNSRFHPDRRWGTFYSVGASWVLSDEAFLEGASGWLNTTKIRASYGKAGNAGIDPNQFQALLSYGGTYNGLAAAYPEQFGNNLLTWENSASLDVGLDFGLFDRVHGSVDYFHRTTYDLLLDVPLSYTTGFDEQTQNVGEMVNKGWELTLNTDVFRNSAFQWNIGLNLTSLENEVTKLPRSAEGEEIGIVSSTRRVTEGLPVYAWYMPVWAGVDPENGAPLWYVEGTSGETTSDYREAGESYVGAPMPTFYGGLNNRFEFKGVYLSANLYYSTGNKVYDTWAGYTQSDGRFTYSIANAYARQYDRWQKPGDIAENPINVYGNNSQSNSTSTRRLYDGTFLRLRDVTFGYKLPESVVSRIGLGTVNLFVKGTNAWTWVKDENLEFDPEVNASAFLNLSAPPLKTYTFGVNVSF